MFYKSNLVYNSIIKLNKTWNDSKLIELLKKLEYVSSEDIDYKSVFFHETKNISNYKTICDLNHFNICLSISNDILNSKYTLINEFIKLNSINSDKAFKNIKLNIKYLDKLDKEVYFELFDKFLYLIFINSKKTEIALVRFSLMSSKETISNEYKKINSACYEIYSKTTIPDCIRFNMENNEYEFVKSSVTKSLINTITEGDKIDKHEVTNEYGFKETVYYPWYINTFEMRSYLFNDRCYFFYHEQDLGDPEKRFDNLDDKYFFQNISKFLREYNIDDLYNLNETLFWKLCDSLWLTYTVSQTDANRSLKFKIIIINKLLGYCRFNEEEYRIVKQFHYNVVKQDWYFNKNVSLTNLKSYKFINEDELDYINRLINNINNPNKKISLRHIYTKEEDRIIRDCEFGSWEEAYKLLPGLTKSMINTRYIKLNELFSIYHSRNPRDICRAMERYRKNNWTEEERNQYKKIHEID